MRAENFHGVGCEVKCWEQSGSELVPVVTPTVVGAHGAPVEHGLCEKGLLDGVLVRFQEVHGTIELVQLQSLRSVDMGVFLESLLMAVELGGRCKGAVGDQGKQIALNVESEMRVPACCRTMAAMPSCFQMTSRTVAVGTEVTLCPPHRSLRAELPHKAPASGV